MSGRSEEIETVPHGLDDWPSRSGTQAPARTFARTVTDFFRWHGGDDFSESTAVQVPPREQSIANPTLYRHWRAIQAEGITASQFIALLQPLADLDGITVSYTYSDEDGTEHVYNHRRGDLGSTNPLSRAIQEKKLSKEKALTFALNEEGRVWIESNFMELSDLK